MNIVLNNENVAVFFNAVLTDTCVQLQGGKNNDYTTANATQINVEPPSAQIAFVWKWENDAWVCVDEASLAAYNTVRNREFNVAQKEKRKAAYTEEADPIFFMAQRGEATTEEWQAKVAEIKTKFPYKE
jgi:hypothetical protein